MQIGRVSKWLAVIVLVAAVFCVASAPALAQCAMCYTTAAAQGAKGIQALNFGIIVLLIPPVTIMGGILLYAFRYRNSCEPWKGREFESRYWTLEAGEREGAALPSNF